MLPHEDMPFTACDQGDARSGLNESLSLLLVTAGGICTGLGVGLTAWFLIHLVLRLRG